MNHIFKQYHLNQYNQRKLHFDLRDAAEYLSLHKDKATKAHRHSYYQLIWFKTPGAHYIDYEILEHPANTFFMINKGQVHYFCPYSANEGYLFHFNDVLLSQYVPDLLQRLSLSVFSEILPASVTLSDAEAAKMEALTQLLQNEFSHESLHHEEMICHLLSAILIHLERKMDDQTSLKVASDEFHLAYQFKQQAAANIHQFWSIDQFASALHTNSKMLSKATKRILGDTPARFITNLKILEAKRMLASPASIREVAYHLGFEQATYFTKYFKKETGLTPKEFRQSLP